MLSFFDDLIFEILMKVWGIGIGGLVGVKDVKPWTVLLIEKKLSEFFVKRIWELLRRIDYWFNGSRW